MNLYSMNRSARYSKEGVISSCYERFGLVEDIADGNSPRCFLAEVKVAISKTGYRIIEQNKVIS